MRLQPGRTALLPVAFTEFASLPAVPTLVGRLHPAHQPAAPGAATGFALEP